MTAFAMWLSGLLIQFVLAWNTVQAQELEPVTLQLQWKHQFEFAGFYAAQAKGFYKEAGFDVDIQELSEDSNITDRVLDQKADFGIFYTDLVRSRMEGKPVVLLASYFKRSPLVLVTSPNIRFPQDLIGKRIMATPDQMQSANFLQMFRSFNIQSNQLNRIEHSYNIQDFVDGKVDAFMAFLTNEVFILQDKNIPYNIIDPNNYGLELDDVILFTSEKLAKASPEKVRKFRDASTKGWEYALENPDEIINLITKRYNTQNKSKKSLQFEATEVRKMMMPSIYPIGSIDLNRLKRFENLLIEMDIAQQFVDPSQFVMAQKPFNLDVPIAHLLTEQEKQFIRQNSTVTLGTDASWEPWVIQTPGGELGGLVGELYKKLTDLTGIRFDITLGNWNEILSKASERKIDGLATSFPHPDRSTTFNFSQPFAKISRLIVVPKGNPHDIRNVADLANKTAVMQKGNLMNDSIIREIEGHRILYAKNIHEIIDALASGKADYAIEEESIVYSALKRDVEVIPLKTPLGESTNIVISTRKDFPLLNSILNKALNYLPSNYLKELKAKWFLSNPRNIDTTLLTFTDQELDFIKHSPPIVFSNENDYPPFDFAIQGQPQGYSIDLIRKLMNRTGLKAKFLNGFTWKQLIDKYNAGEIDVVHTVFKSEERAETSLFTRPYFDDKAAFVVRSAFEDIESINQLKNRTVALPKGWAFESFIRKEYPNINLLIVNDTDAAYQAVRNGQADAFSDIESVANYYIKKNFLHDLKVTGWFKEFDGENSNALHMMVKKDNRMLHTILEKALATITPDEVDSLNLKWIGKRPNTKALKLTNIEKDFLKSHPVVRVSNDDNWPPMDFSIEGTPTGYSVDMLNLISSKIPELTLQFENGYSWSEILDMGRNRELDVLHSLSVTDERKAFLSFTSSYISIPTVIVTQTDVPPIKSVSQFKGKTISVLADTDWSEMLQAEFGNDISILEVQSVQDGLRNVSFGQADALVDSLSTVSWLIKDQILVNLKINADASIFGLEDSNFHIAVRSDWPELHSIMQKGLLNISIEEKNRLSDKWFNVTYGDRVIPLTIKEKQYLINKNTIKLCIDPKWMPYEQLNENGQHEGMSADYMALIGELTGGNFEVYPTQNWEASILAVKNRECDLLPMVTETEARTAFLDFTLPYVNFPFVIATRSGESFIDDISLFLDKPFGTVKGYSIANTLRNRYPTIKLKEFNSIAEGIRALQQGSIYGFIDATAAITYHIQNEDIIEIKIAGKLDDRFSLSVATRNDEPILQSVIQKALNAITDEERNRLYNKWVAVKVESGIDYTLIWKIVAALAIVIAFFVLWNRKLIHEIKRRKIVEKELIKAEKSALKANQAKGEFLANMSHEIRTPMNAIIGLNTLALSELKPDDQVHDFIKKSLASARSLMGIINDILDFSKIEAGKLDVEKVPMNVNQLVQQMDDMFSFVTSEKGLSLEFAISEDFPHAIIGDPLRLNQVLTNLISNAIKFTEKGGVYVSITAIENVSGDKSLCFSVKDTGKGIAEELKSHLFESFTQEDTTISRRFGGTGLGLAISKNLVHLMGGEISFASELGKGSEFRFKLPLIPYRAQKEDLDHRCGNDINILFIDDDPYTYKVAQHLVSGLAVNLEYAESPSDALTLIQAHPNHYLILLIDFNMPEHDGFILRQQLLEMENLEVVPRMVLITGHHNENLHQKALEAGFDGYLNKPLDHGRLLTLIVEQSESLGISLDKATLLSDEEMLKRRILLVEDNDTNLDVATHFLHKMVGQVDIAKNGEMAVKQVLSHPPDYYGLVLMDIHMPVLDGYKATLQIRENDAYDKLPIIAMTANAMSDDIDRYTNIGMQGHLPKPFEVDQLKNKLNKWLAHSGQGYLQTLAEPNFDELTKPIEVTLPSTPTLNAEAALERLMGETSLFCAMLTALKDEHIPALEKIETLVSHPDKDESIRIVHTIKGVARSSGADLLADTVQIIETGLIENVEIQTETLAELPKLAQQTATDIVSLLNVLE